METSVKRISKKTLSVLKTIILLPITVLIAVITLLIFGFSFHKNATIPEDLEEQISSDKEQT